MKYKKLLIFGIFLSLFFPFNIANAFEAESFDTIAGFETMIKASELRPYETVVLRLINPNGQREIFSLKADENGKLQKEISSSLHKKAGAYRIEVISKALGKTIGEISYEVFSDNPSEKFSSIYVNQKEMSADGVSQIKVTVHLQDNYGNPIKNHEINLISSRKNDQIDQLNNFTDKNGNAVFFISSFAPGTSFLTAIDQTQGLTLEKRVQTLFKGRGFSFKAMGGDDNEVRLLSLADVPNSAINSFEISDLPDEIFVNENISFKLKAVDLNDNTVANYKGTVKFSSPTDRNAIFPNEYTFQATDLGEHMFELSLSFSEEGAQKLIVEDKNNPQIKLEKEILVKKPRRREAASGITITKPIPGSYGTNIHQIEGAAPANSTVNIFDNGQQIGIVRASSQNKFSFTTPKLDDGVHVFYAEADGQVSNEVEIEVQATGAAVQEFILSKNPVAPGDSTEVTLHTEASLEAVSVIVSDLIIDLTETEDGVYKGTLVAPNEAGIYPIDVNLTDSFGNESSYSEVEFLKVDESLKQTRVTFRVPSKVTGISAMAGNGRVVLKWTASTDDTGIAFYKIYYGIDRNDLSSIAQTSGDRAQWYIPNLRNGITYFFQVVGVDTEGNEGHQRSAVVSATPEGEFGALESAKIPESEALPEDGPASPVLFFVAPFLAYLLTFFRKRR